MCGGGPVGWVSDAVSAVGGAVEGIVDEAISNPGLTLVTGGASAVLAGGGGAIDEASGGFFTELGQQITGQEDLEAAEDKLEQAAALQNAQQDIIRQQEIRMAAEGLDRMVAMQQNVGAQMGGIEGFSGQQVSEASSRARLASQISIANELQGLAEAQAWYEASAGQSAQAASNAQGLLQQAGSIGMSVATGFLGG